MADGGMHEASFQQALKLENVTVKVGKYARQHALMKTYAGAGNMELDIVVFVDGGIWGGMDAHAIPESCILALFVGNLRVVSVWPVPLFCVQAGLMHNFTSLHKAVESLLFLHNMIC